MKVKALELAKHLFELEVDSIFNDSISHWLINDWYNKYGHNSIKHNIFSCPQNEIQKLADILYDDYKNNRIDTLEYYYMMPTIPTMYRGFITKVFEKELASKTKIGYQLNI